VVVTNTSDSDPRKIAKPDCLNETLLFWLLHAHKGRQRHDTAARRYERCRLFLAIVSSLSACHLGSLSSPLRAGTSSLALSALPLGCGSFRPIPSTTRASAPTLA
jgi:hypothetical protein